MRLLICGLGSIGRRHLRNLLALGERDIVLFRSGRSTLADEDLPDLPVERDLEIALERWRPDAVIVSNPTSLHMEVAIPAAKAGCSLLIEKPVSHSLEGVNVLVQALKEHRARLLVGFQFRFHPGLRMIKSILQSGEIGRPISARAHWGEYLPDWHPWENYRQSYAARADLGGGVLLTLCHPLDYLVWMMGEPAWVQASLGTCAELGLEVEDTAEILLGFPDGGLGSVHLDYIQRPPRHCLEIVGTGGTLRWIYEDGTLRVWRAEDGRWQQFPAPEGFERNDMFLEEMRHFLRVLRREEEPECSLEQGLISLRIALAAKRSSETGRRIALAETETA